MGADSSNNLYSQKGHALQIMHVATGKIVEFKAFLTNYDDKYTSKWNPESVYGRMDPISTFEGTSRQISIAWDVLAFSNQEAVLNLQKASLLFQMLYPVYEKSEFSGAGQISAAPLLKIKFANLICSTTNGNGKGGVQKSGLLGYVDGFSLKPNFENQFHDPEFGLLYPMSYALSCNFTVLHTHKLGWTGGGSGDAASRGAGSSDNGVPQFPYGAPFPAKSSNKINELADNDAKNEQNPNSVQSTGDPNDPNSVQRTADQVSGYTSEDGTSVPIANFEGVGGQNPADAWAGSSIEKAARDKIFK